MTETERRVELVKVCQEAREACFRPGADWRAIADWLQARMAALQGGAELPSGGNAAQSTPDAGASTAGELKTRHGAETAETGDDGLLCSRRLPRSQDRHVPGLCSGHRDSVPRGRFAALQ